MANELKSANVKTTLSKYIFSESFAELLHNFSEVHHKDHFKIFNSELEKWSAANSLLIEKEIETMRTAGYDGPDEEIMSKIKISARFYYRKKSKREASHPKSQEPKKVKAYIGLSESFIIMMDEFIKTQLLINEFRRKDAFGDFTKTHLDHIKAELKTLKTKYVESGVEYEPPQIADKIKKAFGNRYYTLISCASKGASKGNKGAKGAK